MRRDIISSIHSDIRAARIIRRGSTGAPESVLTGLFKEYPRMPRVMLPKVVPSNVSLVNAIQKRTSHHQGPSHKLLTLEQVSSLLATLRIKEDSMRGYPSGGALYPIETYVVGSVEGHENYVFHYHPKAHALEQLWEIPNKENVADMFGGKIDERGTPSAAFVFTAVWERTSSKYGDFAYNLALLEAGHMVQNIILTAAVLDIKTIPIGGFQDHIVCTLLNLNEIEEQTVYTIAVF